MVESLAEAMSAEMIEKGVDEYLDIGGFLDGGVRQQTLFDLEAFESATGRILNEEERDEFIDIQHQANRWTYIGTGMTHPKFLMSLERLNPEQRERIEMIAPMFC
jgi:hypothetical protein